MSRAPRVLLINDNSAHENWGAQATPFALKRMLQRSMPNVEISALTWDWLRFRYRRPRVPFLKGRLWREDRLGSLRPLLLRASTYADFFPQIADDFEACADDWQSGAGGPQAAEFLHLAESASVVVYNGENSIYLNTVEGCHSLFLLWLAKARLGRPSCIVNHTADLNEVWPIMNAMVKLVGPALDLVAAREPFSLRNLHKLGIHNAVLYPDVVFSEDPAWVDSGLFDRWRREVGLTKTQYFCFSGSGLPASQPRAGREGAVVELVQGLTRPGVRPVLVARDPNCQFLAEVARRVDGVFFGPEHRFTELWPLFQGAQFLVTGHFHYAIIGSTVGCPFVPLSTNNHKMQGACELLQWHRAEPFDITWLRSCARDIIAECAHVVRNREALSRHLLGRAAELRREARRLGDKIAEIAQGVSLRPDSPPGTGP